MKLMHCLQCSDVLALRLVERTCECGACRGAYDANGTTAWVSGPVRSIAIGNGSLTDALRLVPQFDANRAFYPVMAWVRPNAGPGNPHTREE